MSVSVPIRCYSSDARGRMDWVKRINVCHGSLTFKRRFGFDF